MATIKDNRTAEQQNTHYLLVIGLDKWMSGWGGAEGGKSYAAWATDFAHCKQVEAWVRGRGDMSYVRVREARNWKPRGKYDHVHIYAVDDTHPSML